MMVKSVATSSINVSYLNRATRLFFELFGLSSETHVERKDH